MKKVKRLLAVLTLFVMLFSFSATAFALDTDYGTLYHVNGNTYVSGSNINAEFIVTNKYGMSGTLSCSLSGNGYNGVGSIVGTYSGSNTVYNKSWVKATASTNCYVGPAYTITWYTFDTKTWAE